MSFAVDTGFAFRFRFRIVFVPPQVKVLTGCQLVVYTMYRHVVDEASAETTSRWPEFDSHAMAACPYPGWGEFVLTSTKLVNALPSQINAVMSFWLMSPPTSPIWSLPFLGASSTSPYGPTLGFVVSSYHWTALHAPLVYVM